MGNVPAWLAARVGARRWHRRRKVAKLHALGLSVAAIARELGVSRSVVERDHEFLKLPPHKWSRKRPPDPEPRPSVPTCRGLFRYRLTAALERYGQLSTSHLVFRAGNPERYLRDLWRAHSVLLWLHRAGEVRKESGKNCVIWSLVEPRRLMTLVDAKNLILHGEPLADVIEHVAEGECEELKRWFCETPGLPNLKARAAQATRAAPASTGEVCKCGGLMVRTGTCLTCQSCGESSGGCS